ncbi:DNA-binding response regulator, LytR/AlgR family [Algoriphagus locisalis]|uniref:DNA-binding response regulator, LytR/AlgR family n=1 Tax=Algoriphagus locisalis TaxID=305507 RepID=A0A1I7CQF0_9BACT|nr:LytTR family DNA-binding domain-containing protein [Algoriphagus locisalis]SFU01686.1 DNA-binding response regulator, LytR/AlgR family [Algoriphagus locisalis]
MDRALRCIIVDDEEGAHLVLRHYLKDLKYIKLEASFYNALQAMEYMYQNTVDLMFLDINMPGLTGLQMLKSFTNPPMVILTTAYGEYALESYEYRVIDYLVKPFDFHRFLLAIDNVLSRLPFKEAEVTDMPTEEIRSGIMLKVDGDILKVSYNEILYIQSWGNYVKVFTVERMYLSPITTAEIEQKLDTTMFIRTHKSYIVALKHIKRIAGGQIELDNDALVPIGSSYRRQFLQRFTS